MTKAFLHSLIAASIGLCGLHAEEPEKGFVPMFNGKDLTGWQTTGNWVVKEGNIVTLEPREGEHGWTRYADYITTVKQYGNFELKLDFKFNKRGNSGVFMRVGISRITSTVASRCKYSIPTARRNSGITTVVG